MLLKMRKALEYYAAGGKDGGRRAREALDTASERERAREIELAAGDLVKAGVCCLDACMEVMGNGRR